MTEVLRSPGFTLLRYPTHVETALPTLVDSRQTATTLERIHNTSGLLLTVDADTAMEPDTIPAPRGGTVEGMLEGITSFIFEHHALPEWRGDYAVDDFAPLASGEPPGTLQSAHQDLSATMAAVAATTVTVPGQEALTDRLSHLLNVVQNAMDCWETAFQNSDDARIREEAITRLGWDPSCSDDAASLPDAR